MSLEKRVNKKERARVLGESASKSMLMKRELLFSYCWMYTNLHTRKEVVHLDISIIAN